jgi:hypothetical protein
MDDTFGVLILAFGSTDEVSAGLERGTEEQGGQEKSFHYNNL